MNPPISSASASSKPRRAKSIFVRIQLCIATLFIILVASTINLARLSGKLLQVVDAEVKEGTASVYKTIQKFQTLRQQALAGGVDDDDVDNKGRKNDNTTPIKMSNLPAAQPKMDKTNLLAAHQMEHGGDEMDQFAAKQLSKTASQQKAESANQQQADDATPLQEKNVPIHKGKIVKSMPEWLQTWCDQHRDGNLDQEWMQSQTLPVWLQAYFAWHKEQKALVTESNYKEFRYLVMTCYAEQHCDNIPDRLRPLPSHLRLAAETKRLLLIHWDQPNKLENFVEPPSFGIDWTVPDCMMWKVRMSTQQNSWDALWAQSQLYGQHSKVVNAFFSADNNGGDPFYNDRRAEGEPPAERVFHAIFHTLFQPTPAVEDRVDQLLRFLPPSGGSGYAVAHMDDLRVPQTEVESKSIAETIENALNCLSELKPGGPFMVFAETSEATQMAIALGERKGVRIPAKQRAHDTHRIAQTVLESFAEVFLMARAKCIAYNNGGFGRLGYSLLQQYDCHVRYAGKDGKNCTWVDGPATTG